MSTPLIYYRQSLDRLEPNNLKKYTSTLIDKDREIMKDALYHYFRSQPNGKVSLYTERLKLFIKQRGINPIERKQHNIDTIPVDLINHITSFLNVKELARLTMVKRCMYIGCYHSNRLRYLKVQLRDLLMGRYYNKSLVQFQRLKSLSLQVGINANANLYTFGTIMTNKLDNLTELKIGTNFNIVIELRSIIAVLKAVPNTQKLYLTNINLVPFNQHQYAPLLHTLKLNELHSLFFTGGSYPLLSIILGKCSLKLRSLNIIGLMPEFIAPSILNLPELKQMKIACFDETVFCQMLSSTRCLEKIGIERRAGSPRDEVFFPFINQVLCQHLQLNYMQIMDNNNGGSSFEPILKEIHDGLLQRNIRHKGLPSFLKFEIWNKQVSQLSKKQIDRIRSYLHKIIKYFHDNGTGFMLIWKYKSINDPGIVKAIGNPENGYIYLPPKKDLAIANIIDNPANGYIYQVHVKDESNERQLVIQTKGFNRGTVEIW